MKRFYICFLVCLLMIKPVIILADSSSNIDSGGGSMGNATDTDRWYGADGVRITIVRNSDHMPVSTPVDFSNFDTSDIQIHFQKISKISYANGTILTPIMRNYSVYKPSDSIPRIVTSSGSNNISAIRSYFCDESAIRVIAVQTGFTYERLISGDYKILLEPIAYFRHGGIMYAMTATEAGLFNKMSGGTLRSKVPSLSHQNLPLSMFLEYADLGFEAWDGSTSSKQSDEDIIHALGLGIVRFSEPEPEAPREGAATYRCNTEVITSVILNTTSEKTPKEPAYATFIIDGKAYTHSEIYIPENGSQLAWVKWRTPNTPGTVTITVTSNCYVNSSLITAKIVSMDEKVPPDPKANDRNDGFTAVSTPSKVNKTSLTWGEWDCWWNSNWVWQSNWKWYSSSHTGSCPNDCTETHGFWQDEGKWADKGWYEFKWIPYTATLSAAASVMPDVKNPTAAGKVTKSGYGFNLSVSTDVRSSAPNSHLTGIQTVAAYFPEFKYKTYWRLLEASSGGSKAFFEFQKNKYSTYSRRVHFLPVWYPDGEYIVYAETYDAWTPAGMLQINLMDSLTIKNSVFDDWHIKPLK